jgi:hypothetical protein
MIGAQSGGGAGDTMVHPVSHTLVIPIVDLHAADQTSPANEMLHSRPR